MSKKFTIEIKSPEQLSIGDIIPSWGPDLVVSHAASEQETPDSPLNYRVTFENGQHTIYPIGTAIRVIRPG